MSNRDLIARETKLLKLEVTDKQRCAIESSAQKILDVRAKYPDATLADLYDELTMPADLRTVHKKMTAPSVSTENFCAVSRILQTSAEIFTKSPLPAADSSRSRRRKYFAQAR